METLKTVETTQLKWNNLLKACDNLGTEDGVDLIMTQIKPPVLFVSGRLVIDGRYLVENPASHEYMCMFSSKGNDHLIEVYLSEHPECKDLTIAKAIISGHWYRPLFDEDG